ncbi:unnamed protein product [Caenorhabditis bovis]|uniref:Transmembrane protein 209 n=1 Tax=Caenorhabditis bovis TaxID=2654633 RepID=A0A8S1EEL4_9PELO|nr:unnamed protein product [Caenorhabditis bovis]
MASSQARERLSRLNTSQTQLNTSAVSNTSAFEDKFSPLCKTRLQNDTQRYEDLRIASIWMSFKLHSALLLVLTVDALLFKSSILSFLILFGSLPEAIIQSLSLLFIIYCSVVSILLVADMKFPKASNTVLKAIEQLYQSSTETPAKPKHVEKTPSSEKILSTSMSDHSWVDAHKFGTPVTTKPVDIISKKPSDSFRAQPDVSPLIDDSKVALNWKSPSAYGKPIDSIHTRKQLEVLLKSHANDAPIDKNASQSSYFSSIWNVLDFGRGSATLLNSSYQVSKEITDDTQGNSPYKLKIGKDGRTELKLVRRRQANERIDEADENDDDELTKLHKVMNAARNVPEVKSGILKRSNSMERGRSGIRRRSQSSPDRSPVGDQETRARLNDSLLTEEQQRRAEFRVRAWLRNTIILPLAEQIEEINEILDKEHANPPLRIGSSTVDALKLAIMERDSLKTSNLPFLLPFLSIHTNQAYLVSRVKELSASEFMDVYKWNSGGTEPSEDKLNSSRIVHREWNDSLPTDACLVFDAFLTYMDTQLNSNCLVGEHRLDQPFSSRYALKFPKKPSPTQKTPFEFYLHMASINPPHFEFVHNDANGSPVKLTIARQTSNLFRAIAQFVHHVKEMNHGYLDQTSLGPTGINLLCVLS